MAWYIQRRRSGVLETIEEIDDSREAHRVASEYNLKDKTAYHYVARSPCQAWRKH